MMTERTEVKAGWGVLWRTTAKSADGPGETLLGVYAFHGDIPAWVSGGHTVAMFRTRKEALAAIQTNYGYIAQRPDLHAAPHGWLMPLAVRIKATTTIEAAA